MKKNQKIIVLFALVIVFVLGLTAFLISNKTKVANNGISATVTDVVERQNLAENGHYGITVEDTNGRQYSINATGYLNTPLPPGSKGETCVDIPKVNIGDRVLFNLPKSEEENDTFVICHEKNLTGYYFTVE